MHYTIAMEAIRKIYDRVRLLEAAHREQISLESLHGPFEDEIAASHSQDEIYSDARNAFAEIRDLAADFSAKLGYLRFHECVSSQNQCPICGRLRSR